MEDWTDDDLANYRGTEYIGKLGVEQSYESELHGTTGFEQVETSAGGRAVRRLTSNPATPGNTLVLSIDIRLQAMVEELFGDRRGALVAIDPRNGEVLAFVSKPNFDPNLFVDGIDSENWTALNESPDKPLLNRALRGTYPPGSTYKPFMALAALDARQAHAAADDLRPGLLQVRQPHASATTRKAATARSTCTSRSSQSCDTYYYMLANDLGVDAIARLHGAVRLRPASPASTSQGELRGVLPSTEWKRKAYRKPEQQKWYAGETISLGIGQGYNSFTMLQLAQADGDARRRRPAHQAAPGARRSSTTRRASRGRSCREPLAPLPTASPSTSPSSATRCRRDTGRHLGARRSSARRYTVGGKTGTAQVVEHQGRTRSTTPRKVDERHRDHALYIAFAPLEEPQHRARDGGRERRLRRAAPRRRSRAACSTTVLAGQYPSEADIAATQIGQSTAPIGTPRPIDAVPLPGATVDGAATRARPSRGRPRARRSSARRRRRRRRRAGCRATRSLARRGAASGPA